MRARSRTCGSRSPIFPPEALNWEPAGEDTNSVAVLTTHSLHSTRSWLSTALGEPLPDRDRDSEFRVAEDNPEALLTLFDDMAGQCTALFEKAGEVDWAAIRSTHTRPDAERRDPGAGGVGSPPRDRAPAGASGPDAAYPAVWDARK